MSVLDNALQQIWKDGIKLVEVWRNASPASSFAAQTIPIDMSQFDIALAIFNISATMQRKVSAISPVGWYGEAQWIGNIGSEYTTAYFTRMYICRKSEIEFNDTNRRQVDTDSISNNNLIPYAIYGIKILEGAIKSI